ncbi:MAG: CPBP family glutamic-type intramembrane protease [Myxococcota bacterium]
MVEAIRRAPYAGLVVAAVSASWFGLRWFTPWVQRVTGFADRVTDPDLQQILGHWVFWQLPAVVLCAVVWAAGQRFGLLPRFTALFGAGGSWRRVLTAGAAASVVLLAATLAIGAAAGGRFGFHPYAPKMVGDLASNLYEEFVNRGLVFCALYGVVAARPFGLARDPTFEATRLHRAAILVATVGSCALFAAGHGQYPVPLRVVLGVLSVAFVWPFVVARSLWAPWIPHTVVDVIADSILVL